MWALKKCGTSIMKYFVVQFLEGFHDLFTLQPCLKNMPVFFKDWLQLTLDFDLVLCGICMKCTGLSNTCYRDIYVEPNKGNTTIIESGIFNVWLFNT